MTAVLAPAPKSIWDPVHLGVNEIGQDIHVTMAERNMLIGGEPGSGKSVALQLIVAHGALSPDCKLLLVDGKRVELGLWRGCAERFIGPSMDDAIDTLQVAAKPDRRTHRLAAGPQETQDHPGHGLPGLPGHHRRAGLLLRHRRHPDPAEGIQRAQPRHRGPRPGTRHHPGRGHPTAISRHRAHQPA